MANPFEPQPQSQPHPHLVSVIGGVARPGDRVRLHPHAKADAFDMLLEYRLGRVESIQQDFEDRMYLVITLEDDPGREPEEDRVLPGHRFFFYPDEIELVGRRPHEWADPGRPFPEDLDCGHWQYLLWDDGFGVEVAQRLLARRHYPANVEVVDFGIRGVDLAYTLLDDYDELILVDAVPRGGAPGTLYVIEPDLTSMQQAGAQGAFLDAHSMDPVKVLAFAHHLGARPIHTLLVGCEPAVLGNAEEDLLVGLSDPVQAMIPAAIEMIDQLVDKLSMLPEIVLPPKGVVS
ncbi:hydrogenase maturation protease [Dictyobacter kobayashii]|uniref:Hydrogenase maturation protease n=1 Tax=Dictyobacter kobayashii TaxID=2014872 RepID=A0A402AYW3_9CHLR|nr:hydrogenase maturation protease [Dictyobacter kobayashii]GCE24300.1 hypothetical protein KDK_81000 [Dictyobacter kobayashii]